MESISATNNISSIDDLGACISKQPKRVPKALLERLQSVFDNVTQISEEQFYAKIDHSLISYNIPTSTIYSNFKKIYELIMRSIILSN